jgi:hypothetical protein
MMYISIFKTLMLLFELLPVLCGFKYIFNILFVFIHDTDSSLAIFHAYRGEKISIQHIEKKQELCNTV